MSELSKLSHQESHSFRRKIEAASISEIERSTVCFYGEQNGKVVQNGSGVLFAIAEKHVLLTAAHVIDFAGLHGIPYYIAPRNPGEKLIPFDKVKVHTSPVPSGRRRDDPDMRDDDPFDIAICVLPDEIVTRLATSRFIRQYEIDQTIQTKQSIYMMMGYPYVLTRLANGGKDAHITPYRLVTELYTGEPPEVLEDYHILLKHGPSSLNANDQIESTIHPKGVSGGGIWRLADPEKPITLWKPEDVKLVGIEHRWNQKMGFARATSIFMYLSLMCHVYPSLRSALTIKVPTTQVNWKL